MSFCNLYFDINDAARLAGDRKSLADDTGYYDFVFVSEDRHKTQSGGLYYSGGCTNLKLKIRHEGDFLLCGFAISKNRVIGFENTNRILKIYNILKELLKDLLRRSIVVTACEVEV